MATREEVTAIARAAALAITKHLEKVYDPPAGVRLVGVAPRPPSPEAYAELREKVEERRTRGVLPGMRLRLLRPEDIEKIWELHDKGMTYYQIAGSIGRNRSTVRTVILRGRREPLRKAVTSERLDEIVGFRKLGYSPPEIAKRLGYTNSHIHWLLNQAGETIDIGKEIDRLRVELKDVTKHLSAPASAEKLKKAGDQLERIAKAAGTYIEILPHPTPWNLALALEGIESRAAHAEEVARTGAWCLKQKEKSYTTQEVLADRWEERERPHTPRQKSRLAWCGERTRDCALGYIEDRPGYDVEILRVIDEADELFEELG